MIKKMIYLGLSLIMLFSLAACQGSELAEYKANKSQALQDYADAKGESNYCKTDWAAICKAVTDGKQAIEDATTKPAVTKVYDDAKGVIDKVKEEVVGAFYTLQEAYSEGLLSIADLESIAYYYNNRANIVHPETLIEEKALAIKLTYLQLYVKNDFPTATTEKVNISRYYGTYNDCVAIAITDTCFAYDYLFEPEYFVENILFQNYCAAFVRIWCELG